MNIIREATKDCPRSDCVIRNLGGMTTCMAYTPTYNKNGDRIDKGDPNTSTQNLVCAICGNRWRATTQYGETKLERMEYGKPIE